MSIFNIFKPKQKEKSIFNINPNVMIIEGIDELLDKYQFFTIEEKKKLSQYCESLMDILSFHKSYLQKIGKTDKNYVEKSSFEVIPIFWLILTNQLSKKNSDPKIANIFYDIIYYSIYKNNSISSTPKMSSLENYDNYFQEKSHFYFEVLKMLPNAQMTAIDYLRESIINNPFEIQEFGKINNNSFMNSIVSRNFMKQPLKTR